MNPGLDAPTDDRLVSRGGRYLSFRLATEHYAISVGEVREIIALPAITRIPRSPPFVRGVVNLRGRVITVVDLRVRFGMGRVEETEQAVVVLCEIAGEDGAVTFGLLCDEVLEVHDLQPSQVGDTPDFATDSVEPDFLRGVARIDDRVVFLLALARLVDERTVRPIADS